MYRIFTVIAIVASTSTLVVSKSSSDEPNSAQYNSIDDKNWQTLHNTSLQSVVAKAVRLDSISQGRSLLGFIPRMPHITVKSVNTAASSQCHTIEKGNKRHLKGCDSNVFTILAQSYLPTVMKTSRNKQFFRIPTIEEVDDWNNNLKIYGLWPRKSKQPQSRLPFTLEARNEVKEHDWPVLYKRPQGDLYSDEWKTHGVKSGLIPVQYILEINRLHRQHPTPDIIKGATQSSVSLAELKAAFGSNACLICKMKNNVKLFSGVQYCHRVDSNTGKVMGMVPYSNCDNCAKYSRCDQENVMIPKIEPDQPKCENSTRKDCENEYSSFAQAYLPTIITTGRRKHRQPTLEEVNDWNNNLKIHGLWPQKYKVSESTSPFTQDARAAVNGKAWLSIRSEETELYLHEWKTHGIHSGFKPLEYIREINRLHTLHSTPDLLKGSESKIIPLATLKQAFGGLACLKCRPTGKDQLFLEVYYCHLIDSMTRQAGKVVPFSNCGECSLNTACTKENIIIPKIGTGQPSYTKLDNQNRKYRNTNRKFDAMTSKNVF